jgi:hypothetical protein
MKIVLSLNSRFGGVAVPRQLSALAPFLYFLYFIGF